ncbi:hypothetical protein N2152v2_000009 [Parachlorella kessleri]
MVRTGWLVLVVAVAAISVAGQDGGGSSSPAPAASPSPQPETPTASPAQPAPSPVAASPSPSPPTPTPQSPSPTPAPVSPSPAPTASPNPASPSPNVTPSSPSPSPQAPSPSPSPPTGDVTLSAILQLEGLNLTPWNLSSSTALMAACASVLPLGAAQLTGVAIVSTSTLNVGRRRKLLGSSALLVGAASIPSMKELSTTQVVVAQALMSAAATSYTSIYWALTGAASTGLLATAIRDQNLQVTSADLLQLYQGSAFPTNTSPSPTPVPSPSPQASSSGDDSSSSFPTWAIIAASAGGGGLVLLAVLVIVCVVVCGRKRRAAAAAIKRTQSTHSRGGTADIERAYPPSLRSVTGEQGATPRKSAIKRTASSGTTVSVHANTVSNMPPALYNTMAAVGALKAEREDRGRRVAELAAIRFAMANSPRGAAALQQERKQERQTRRAARVYFGETLPTGSSTLGSEIIPSDSSPRSQASGGQFSMRSRTESQYSMRSAAGMNAPRAPSSSGASRNFTSAGRPPLWQAGVIGGQRGRPPVPGVALPRIRTTTAAEHVQRGKATVNAANSPRRHRTVGDSGRLVALPGALVAAELAQRKDSFISVSTSSGAGSGRSRLGRTNSAPQEVQDNGLGAPDDVAVLQKAYSELRLCLASPLLQGGLLSLRTTGSEEAIFRVYSADAQGGVLAVVPVAAEPKPPGLHFQGSEASVVINLDAVPSEDVIGCAEQLLSLVKILGPPARLGLRTRDVLTLLVALGAKTAIAEAGAVAAKQQALVLKVALEVSMDITSRFLTAA